jgi:transposase
MAQYTEVFVGIDVAKARNAIAVADGGRGGEVRFVGEVDASVESMRRMVKRIAASCDRAHFCYEAGPTGYGLHRLITSLGYPCMVVAPSMIPRKPGDRVKTNRRDAVTLAKLLRADELTAVWVPDGSHEAMRDLVRARAAAVEAQRIHRQQVSGFMLKHGRVFPRTKAWTMRYLIWLQEQKFDHPAHQIALQEMVEAVRVSKERVRRLEAAIEEFLPRWSLAPVVQALQALRGVDLIVAVTFATEIGDLGRFENPRQLMGYVGLVPSERSPARAFGGVRSPRPGMGGCATCWSRAPGLIVIRLGSGRRSSTNWRRPLPRSARLPGRRRPGSRLATGPSARGARRQPSSVRPSLASWWASCGP